MGKKIGWEFLFSNDKKESGSHTDDFGNEWYIYSDGSAYYRGVDGSDGYKYSDGSGYFKGSDGSDGYKYSDGSGYFKSPDGIDAYQYSDGSGYYTDKYGEREEYSAEEGADNYESKESDQATWSDIASIAKGAAWVGISKLADYYNSIPPEVRRAKKRQRFWMKNWWKVLLSIPIGILCIYLIIVVMIQYSRIPVGYTSHELLGQDYESVVLQLKASGFANI